MSDLKLFYNSAPSDVKVAVAQSDIFTSLITRVVDRKRGCFRLGQYMKLFDFYFNLTSCKLWIGKPYSAGSYPPFCADDPFLS